MPPAARPVTRIWTARLTRGRTLPQGDSRGGQYGGPLLPLPRPGAVSSHAFTHPAHTWHKPARSRHGLTRKVERTCSTILTFGRVQWLEPREALDVLLECARHRGGDRGADGADRGEEVVRPRGRVPPAERALEGGLRRLPRRELDVGGREVLRALGELVEVDLVLRDGRDVAMPDPDARLLVGRTDRKQVVEAAWSREGVVEIPHRVRRADEQAGISVPEGRDQLQQLVRDRARLRLVLATRGDVLHLVDERDGAFEREQPVEELPQRARTTRPVAAGELAREDLDERPAEPSGDGLCERRLPGSGRPEEDHGGGGDDAVTAGLLLLGEREDHASLDQLLFLIHAADRQPEILRRPHASELLHAIVGGPRMKAPLDQVSHGLVLRVAGGARDHRDVVVRGEDRELAGSERQDPPLELVEQRVADPASAPLGRHRPAKDPRPRPVESRGHRADDTLAGERDECRLPCGESSRSRIRGPGASIATMPATGSAIPER